MSGAVLDIAFESLDGGRLARVRLLGQKSLNLVDDGVLREATAAFEALTADPTLRCVLLEGKDDRAFIGGANLHVLGALDDTTAEPFIRSIHAFCDALRRAPMPVVGVLRGYCIGAGLEIAAACDVRIGDRSFRCGMPEVRIGVLSVVEAALLPGLVGSGKARELVLRGHLIDAAESFRIGVLQHLVDAAALDALALEIARDCAAGAPGAIAAQKRLCLAWEDAHVSAAIEHGVTAFCEAYRSNEPATYVDRFFNPEKPGR